MLSSTFISKFGTNFSADDEERNLINSMLVDPLLRLKHLDEEVMKLQGAIDRLNEERGELLAYVEAHRAFLSPMRRIPTDIMREIFLACMPTARNCVMSATEAPILLGRICSAWRAISLLTPRLWCRLHVVEPHLNSYIPPPSKLLTEFNDKMAQRVAVTGAWLSRSGQCPLSISAKFAPENPRTNDAGPILHALLPFASRWENVSLICPASVLANMPTFSEADLPTLKSLGITDTDTSSDGMNKWDSLSLCRAPKLSRFCASGSDFTPLELPLRWNQLQELSVMKYWSPDIPISTSKTALQLLSLCPGLEALKMYVCDEFASNASADGSSILHQSLRRLDVECAGSLTPIVRNLCGRLALPELRELLIHGSARPDFAIEDISYSSFLVASPHLETVQVLIDMFTKSSLVEFIRCLPYTMRSLDILQSVSSWDIDRRFVDNDVLSLLLPSPPTDSILFCPNLQDLILNTCSSVSDEQLRDFITSKMSDGAHSKLRKITVHFPRSMQVDILPELQEFVDGGLKADFQYHFRSELQLSPWYGVP